MCNRQTYHKIISSNRHQKAGWSGGGYHQFDNRDWVLKWCLVMLTHRVLARIFAIGGTLCIINDLGGVVNNRCGQLHVRELQITYM